MLKTISERATTWTLALIDTLGNDATWSQPLTILLKTNGRKIKAIRQDNIPVKFEFSGAFVIFAAISGKNKIIITKQ